MPRKVNPGVAPAGRDAAPGGADSGHGEADRAETEDGRRVEHPEAMAPALEALARFWRVYADTGPGPEAPMYHAIARAVAADRELLAVCASAPPATHHPNHLLAAVRFLLLGGVDHPLAAAYQRRDVDAAVAHFRSFVREYRDGLLLVLASNRVQTNETGRTAIIAPLLHRVHSRENQPLALIDVGTSAGLNLLVDRVRVDYGDFQYGPADSPLTLTCPVEGPLPSFDATSLGVAWRMGLDRAPIDLGDDAAVRWLRSCVWVDHGDRLDRLTTAIALARAHPSRILTGDAIEDLPAAVAEAPPDLHLVVLTTWVVFYLDLAQRAAFERVLLTAGRPLSWVSVEHPGVVGGPTPEPPPLHQVVPSAIMLVRFAGDGEPATREFLGWAHHHGRWLDWRAEPLTSSRRSSLG